MNETLAAPGVADIIDFHLVAWGNAYFNTSACHGPSSYDRGKTLTCWQTKCAPGADNMPSDCYTAKMLCQHGDAECTGNKFEACAFAEAKGDVTKWAPFVDCLEETGTLAVPAISKCAVSLGLDDAKLSDCAIGGGGVLLLRANAKATAAYAMSSSTPAWQGTPTVTVAGKTLSNPNQPKQLLNAVCKAWTDAGNTAPKGCPSNSSSPRPSRLRKARKA